MNTAGLLIEIKGLKAGAQKELHDGLLFQEIDVPLETAEICVKITRGNTPNVLTVFQGRAQTLGDEGFALTVPVEWRDGIPHTRRRGQDNADFILMEEGGHFVNLQVGIVTRAGRFSLTCQEIWRGWLLEDGSFVPSAWKYNYPGSDYAGMWAGTAQTIQDMVQELGLFLYSRGEVQVPDWDPTFPPNQESWKSGVVLYFNAVTGTGLVRGEDGEDYFIHFSRILGSEGLPVLAMGQGVHFRVGKKGPDQSHAPVRSIKA